MRTTSREDFKAAVAQQKAEEQERVKREEEAKQLEKRERDLRKRESALKLEEELQRQHHKEMLSLVQVEEKRVLNEKRKVQNQMDGLDALPGATKSRQEATFVSSRNKNGEINVNGNIPSNTNRKRNVNQQAVTYVHDVSDDMDDDAALSVAVELEMKKRQNQILFEKRVNDEVQRRVKLSLEQWGSSSSEKSDPNFVSSSLGSATNCGLNNSSSFHAVPSQQHNGKDNNAMLEGDYMIQHKRSFSSDDGNYLGYLEHDPRLLAHKRQKVQNEMKVRLLLANQALQKDKEMAERELKWNLQQFEANKRENSLNDFIQNLF